MSTEKGTRGYLVYAGPRSSDGGKFIYLYFRLSDLTMNDNEMDPDTLKTFRAEEKMFRSGSIGAVYDVVFIGDTTVSYSTRTNPCAFWKNECQRTEWRAHEIAYKAAMGLKSNLQKNTLIETLQPIRRAYRKETTDGKRAIMAEVMRIITS